MLLIGLATDAALEALAVLAPIQESTRLATERASKAAIADQGVAEVITEALRH
jgi:hypothetical protein